MGCGDGALVRHFVRLGARAIGIEVSEGQLERARAQAGDGETYQVASGEALPFVDGSADAVLFMKSFHHLPVPAMPLALLEAGRVLTPGGLLVVIEPLPEGTFFQMTRLVEDETEVRGAAYAALKSPPPALIPEDEHFYDSAVRVPNVERVLEMMAAVEPARRERVIQAEAEIRRRFDALVQHDGEGPFFIAPMRRNVFVRAG